MSAANARWPSDLRRQHLLSDQRIELLLFWRHSGFSIDDSVRIPAGERSSLERVARYMLRAPVSLSRMRWSPGNRDVFYASKGAGDDPEQEQSLPKGESIDAIEFVARLIAQIQAPNKHLVFYYGFYSNVARGLRNNSETQDSTDKTSSKSANPKQPPLSSAHKATLRRSWAQLIRRVYEVAPLICHLCFGQLRIISFITQPSIIKKILELLKTRELNIRAPPQRPRAVT